MDDLKDHSLIDVLFNLLTEIKSINERLTQIEEKLNYSPQLIGFKKVLNFDETAEYISVSKSQLYKLTSTRIIPFTKPTGKRIYFERDKLDEWLLQNPHKTMQEIEREASNYILRNSRRKF